jgi:TM2 domain-containing membrane protein YozV
MRKVLAMFFAFLIHVSSVEAAVIAPLPVAPTPAKTAITAAQTSHLSVKEFQKLTGKKMNFAQRLGYKAMQKAQKAAAGGKSQLTALLLCLFIGILGIHRFYLGYTWQGVVQLLTLGGFGVWAFIDLIRIIIGDLKPKDGEYEKPL